MRRGGERAGAGAVLVLALLFARAAGADRLVVAPPRMAGGNASLRDRLRASIEGGLAAAGHEAVPFPTVDEVLLRNAAISSCDTEVCLRRLAELLDARAAVRSGVELLGSSNYSFRLELYDRGAGRIVGRVDDSCAVCTLREANEAMSRAAASLGKQLEPAPSPERAAPPPLPAPTASTPATSSRARLYFGLGATGVILGAGAIAGGAALLALDGRTEIETGPSGDPIQRRFEGRLPGAVLVAAGGVLVVGGSISLWRGAVAKRAGR